MMTNPSTIKRKVIQPSKSPNKDNAVLPTEDPFVITMDQPRSLYDKDQFDPLYSAPYSREYPDPDVQRLKNQGSTILTSDSYLPTPDGRQVKETYGPKEADDMRRFNTYKRNGNNASPINFDDDMTTGLSV
jgi:hypothetical protein